MYKPHRNAMPLKLVPAAPTVAEVKLPPLLPRPRAKDPAILCQYPLAMRNRWTR